MRKLTSFVSEFIQSRWIGQESTTLRKGRFGTKDEADAIVVGSGINGLVAAAELAQAGWTVILLERNTEIGGFIATEERTLPGYLHDTFSSWHPLFVSGPPTLPWASCCTSTASSIGIATVG